MGDYFLPFGLLVTLLLLYLLVTRPQQQERLQRAEMLRELKKNDKVITSGGIIGTITNLSQDGLAVTIRTSEETRLQVLRVDIRGLYETVIADFAAERPGTKGKDAKAEKSSPDKSDSEKPTEAASS